MGPAVLKGAVTNCLRFLGFGEIKRALQSRLPPEDRGRALPVVQSMVAGGVAGAVSAVVRHQLGSATGCSLVVHLTFRFGVGAAARARARARGPN